MYIYKMTYKKVVLGSLQTQANLKEYEPTFFRFIFASYKGKDKKEKLEFIKVPIKTTSNGNIYLNLNKLSSRKIDLLLSHPSIIRLDGKK